MVLDIKPKYDSTMHCLESVYASVAEWMNREYVFIFAYSWAFAYKHITETDTNMSVGRRILLDRNGNWRIVEQDEILEKYCGIKVNWSEPQSIDDYLENVKQEISLGRPVCINTSSFWCPWHPFYQKDSINHYCLVIGIHEDGKSLYCIDPQFAKGVEIFQYKDLVNTFLQQGTFEIWDIKEKNTSWCDLLQFTLNRQKSNSTGNSDFDDMRLLAADIFALPDMKDEIRGLKEVVAAPFTRRINHIGWGRINFAKLLKNLYLISQVPEMNVLADEIIFSGKKWLSVNILLLKACFMNEPRVNIVTAAERIREIADFEEKLACRLQQTIDRYKEGSR